MNKMQFIKKMNSFGDAVIEFMDRPAVLCTTDFRTKYIKNYMRRINFRLDKKSKRNVLIWNWTDNKLESIDVWKVTRMTPLSKILNNKGVDNG